MILVLDYGMGNVHSIANIVKQIGFECCISSDVEDIQKCTHIILPGVGSFDNAMDKLHSLGLVDVLTRDVVDNNTFFLGICLGMQLLFVKSEEGTKDGLGWIPGEVVLFDKEQMKENQKIPNIGWDFTKSQNKNDLCSLVPDERYYFVHSYHVKCEKEYIMNTSHYGYEFVSGVVHNNIFGVQFHPEKSHRYGKELVRRFLELS